MTARRQNRAADHRQQLTGFSNSLDTLSPQPSALSPEP